MADGHPRHALFRAGVCNPAVRDTKLQDLARAVGSGDGRKAFELLRAIAESPSRKMVLTTDRDHNNAG